MKRLLFGIAILVFAALMAAPAPVGAQEEPPEPSETASESAPTKEAETDRPANKDRGKWTRLVGNARMGRRNFVAGVTILVQPEWNHSGLYVTSTDKKGTFRLDQLVEGRYTVHFLKYGLAPVRKDNVALEFPFQAVVEVVMEPSAGPEGPVAIPVRGDAGDTTPAEVKGLVISEGGDPVPEVRVRLLRADGTVDPAFALTDEAGAFELHGLAPGLWRIEVFGPGYLPVRAPASLYGETDFRAVLVEQPANYEPQPLDLMPPEEPIPPPEPVAGDEQASAEGV